MKNLIFTFGALWLIQMASSAEIFNHTAFASDLFRVIATKNSNKNLIYSPASVQTALTLVYIGADGSTAEELRAALKLGFREKEKTVNHYAEFLKKYFNSVGNGPILKMANRIYVQQGLQLVPKFNEIATKHFNSEAEQINFDSAAVKRINTWVENQTENKIQNLLEENSLDRDTLAVLVNAIYFKAKWANTFSRELTTKRAFHVNGNEKTEVDTMFDDDRRCKYADLNEFDAKALELPYANSNLSMLIILPNKVDGLQTLESKLGDIDLNQIEQKLKEENVEIYLPKFKIEFNIELKSPLKELGIIQLFNRADLSSLLSNSRNVRVTKVLHKAFIDVNEEETEAAAATAIQIFPISSKLPLYPKIFRADHPFVFAIRNRDAVFFAGHVVNP